MGFELRVRRSKLALAVALFAIFAAAIPAKANPAVEQGSCKVKAPECLPVKFLRQASSKALADPGLLVIDPATGQEIFNNKSDKPRIPASVMKILTGYTALTYLGGSKQFTTSIHAIESSTSFVILGQSDPWLTMYRSISQKYGPAYAPDLINKANREKATRVEIFYSDLYSSDIAGLTAHFKAQNITIDFIKISKRKAESLAGEMIYSINSATVDQMVSFIIRFSDNRLSDRLAELSAIEHGFKPNKAGLLTTYQDALLSRAIGVEGLDIHDGSGLSKSNRVSSRTVVDLLTSVRNVSEYKSLYKGLPTSGKTGTLKKRFKKVSPNSVGLVKAKTGWVNGTVSLAGYITSGEKEYVFAVIADQLPWRYSATLKARESIDKMIGSLAAPKIIPSVNPANT
jgi:D-alanyl-D-alanine carboxypeptidase/D-alanyl-D-alanine-endopeptidase (penicillin-binding protein 4)